MRPIDRRTLIAAAAALPIASQARAQDAGLDVREAGARWNGRDDDTEAIERAQQLSDVIVLPAGTGRVRQIRAWPGKTFRTAGRETVLWQLPGQPATQAIVEIGASNVTFGACTLRGNIGGDRLEFHHGVRVFSEREAIENVTLGDLWGRDLRGDVLYVGQRRGAPTRRVRFGDVDGDNILRNVVSIVGGSDIQGGRISGRRVGLCILDIEPEEASGPVRGVRVAVVRGGRCQISGSAAGYECDDIRIADLDLDPLRQANSSPPYAHHDLSVGLRLRGLGAVAVTRFRASGFARHVLDHEPERGRASGALTIGQADWRDSNALAGRAGVDPVYARLGGLARFSLTGGGQASGLGPHRAVVAGDNANPGACRMEVRGLIADGRLAVDVDGGVFTDCEVTNPGGQAFLRVRRSRVAGGRYRVSRMAYDGRENRLERAQVNGAVVSRLDD